MAGPSKGQAGCLKAVLAALSRSCVLGGKLMSRLAVTTSSRPDLQWILASRPPFCPLQNLRSQELVIFPKSEATETKKKPKDGSRLAALRVACRQLAVVIFLDQYSNHSDFRLRICAGTE